MGEAKTTEPPKVIEVTPGQIEVAKLKVYLDKRLGKETPEIFKKIAKLGED